MTDHDRSAATRLVHIGCAFTYRCEIDTPTVFQVQPGAGRGVRVRNEEWSIRPEAASRHYRDLYGNPCLRVVMPTGRSQLCYDAVAEVPDAVEDADENAAEVPADHLPDDVLHYTLPSRYCLPDLLGDEAWARFGSTPPGYRRVQAICAHVHQHLQFQYGSSTALSTATDVNTSGLGVCRDFTHLAISLCRALNIPARYAFGYLPRMDVCPDPMPMDFAAWMEVWLADRWWTFDPRNNTRRKGRIVIGTGRDAADVAMATTFGGPELLSMAVHADEVPR
ncbi:MAG TPA: transglutaminase family protein [Actinophytocola sp.]|jgi:transglutaminase-like putative cysteine protease|uniref:transglutaminase-like domain-containing protein n=1 Tax=Actinophytocola sp. TaxID=1872138 RepID=UPI002E038EDA|nr:transglutaminase family protein [Actinophytocola sp.]